MVPAVARQAHVRLLAAEDQARALAETSAFNEISGGGSWGIVTSGVAGTYAMDALRELGLAGKVRLLKLGFTHPLPETLLGDFLAPLTRRCWWWRNWSRTWKRLSRPWPRPGGSA